MLQIVTLLSDFGLMDPFVAEMKAVILSICPDARIVDVSHQVEKFNIRMGSFLLASAAPYFVEGTVHCAVVDPGVGGKRRPIVVETRRAVYVGPDNGLLIPAARRDGIRHVYVLSNGSLMREQVSATFHGRDVFAPAAAHLACGAQPKDCGQEISIFIQPTYAEPVFDGDSVLGEVFHVDGFGNIVTNIEHVTLSQIGLKLENRIRIMLGRKRLLVRYVRTYSDLRGNELGLLVGSHGFLEIACREANAATKLHTRTGQVIRMTASAS